MAETKWAILKFEDTVTAERKAKIASSGVFRQFLYCINHNSVYGMWSERRKAFGEEDFVNCGAVTKSACVEETRDQLRARLNAAE